MTSHVHAGLRSRIRRIAGRYSTDSAQGVTSDTEDDNHEGVTKPRPDSFGFMRLSSSLKAGKSNLTPNLHNVNPPDPHNVGATVPLPMADATKSQTISFSSASGETVVIKQQIQLYAPNNLLAHPLVSPGLSYLGGLPPLLIIAGDKEVLRDEIIYMCDIPTVRCHNPTHNSQFVI